MEQHSNNCLNTNIYSYLETSGCQSSNLYLNVHFFNTNVNWTFVAAYDFCFHLLVSNMHCSIAECIAWSLCSQLFNSGTNVTITP